MKVLTDGQVEEINKLIAQIRKSKLKAEAVLCAKAIEGVLLQGEDAVLKVSC
jgi:hypothetical protein